MEGFSFTSIVLHLFICIFMVWIIDLSHSFYFDAVVASIPWTLDFGGLIYLGNLQKPKAIILSLGFKMVLRSLMELSFLWTEMKIVVYTVSSDDVCVFGSVWWLGFGHSLAYLLMSHKTMTDAHGSFCLFLSIKWWVLDKPMISYIELWTFITELEIIDLPIRLLDSPLLDLDSVYQWSLGFFFLFFPANSSLENQKLVCYDSRYQVDGFVNNTILPLIMICLPKR